jgi:hypothetical protein
VLRQAWQPVEKQNSCLFCRSVAQNFRKVRGAAGAPSFQFLTALMRLGEVIWRRVDDLRGAVSLVSRHGDFNQEKQACMLSNGD